jgi:hypothetical protein
MPLKRKQVNITSDNEIGGTGGKKRLTRNNKIIILCVLILVVVMVAQTIVGTKPVETVEIVQFNQPVLAGALVSQNIMVKRTMLADEFENYGVVTLNGGAKRRSVILWSDRASIVNAYASVYCKAGVPIYWSDFTKSSPSKIDYMENFTGELMSLEVDPGVFGSLIVPGDRLNIRVTYTLPNYTLPTDDAYLATVNQYGSYEQANVPITVREMLFSECRISDFLNSNGESVVDLYQDLLNLPRTEQITTLQSAEWKKKTSPETLLLIVTAEEVEHYTEIQNLGAAFTITMLPRDSSTPVTELLNNIANGKS